MVSCRGRSEDEAGSERTFAADPALLGTVVGHSGSAAAALQRMILWKRYTVAANSASTRQQGWRPVQKVVVGDHLPFWRSRSRMFRWPTRGSATSGGGTAISAHNCLRRGGGQLSSWAGGVSGMASAGRTRTTVWRARVIATRSSRRASSVSLASQAASRSLELWVPSTMTTPSNSDWPWTYRPDRARSGSAPRTVFVFPAGERAETVASLDRHLPEQRTPLNHSGAVPLPPASHHKDAHHQRRSLDVTKHY